MKKLIPTAIVFAAMFQVVQADQVFLDDLVVDGSQCVGLDCVNNEVFGLNTLVLKENNTRLRFVDTSTTAAFPSQDWMLEANDANNGGNNHFSIVAVSPHSATPFTVNAGAGSNSLVIGVNDFIGIGTGTPAQHIHVVHGNAPTLRLEQDGTGGFSPIVWDVSGDEDALTIRADGSDVLTIETNGDLTIAGSLTTLNPAGSFPDYVFSPTYDLMPLDQLQSFVSTNSHLPGIPSAGDVASDGINMTELQVNLLKKVEELTLYTLQQQELIVELQQQLQALQVQSQ